MLGTGDGLLGLGLGVGTWLGLDVGLGVQYLEGLGVPGVVAGALGGTLDGLEDDGVLLGWALLMLGVGVAVELGLALVVLAGDDGAVEPVPWPDGVPVVGWQAVMPTPVAARAIALTASLALFMAESS